jgi:O-antigen ligase
LPETEDLGGRAAYWLATLKGLAQVPLLGLGLGGAEASINRFLLGRPTSVLAVWSHNDYVQVVSELGLMWTALVLGALGWFLRCFKREWDDGSRILGRRMRGFRRAALAGMAITLVHAFFDFHLRLPIVGFHFLLVGALLLTGTKAIGSREQA